VLLRQSLTGCDLSLLIQHQRPMLHQPLLLLLTELLVLPLDPLCCM
jgi:hypothetical protein